MGELDIVIGIPTANNEDSIKETLDSIINQSRKPDRIIVVDNSTDSTPRIIDRIDRSVDVRVDLYKQSNKGHGVGGARQDIYECFQGDILVCIDTDNRVSKTWIEEHANFHKKNPEFGILSNTSPASSSRVIDNPKNSDYFGQSSCSLKKSALEKVDGWDRWFARGEDWDMRIRLWCAGINSYAKNDINKNREKIGIEGRGSFAEKTKLWASKKMSAPSSAFFLEKYGAWYLKFHPAHVLGDLASIVSVLSLLTFPVSLYSDRHLVSIVLLGLPLSLSLIYVYNKGPKKRDEFKIEVSDMIALPIFFILCFSFLDSLIKLLYKDYNWNYAGFVTRTE